MRWTTCEGEGTGLQNKAFACNANTGTNVLVLSFELANDVSQVSGNELVLDFLSQSATMPAWWDFKNAGTCRTGSLGVNVSFDANNVVCVDWAQGLSGAGIGSYTTGTPPSMGTIDPNLANQHRRLTLALAVPVSGLQDLVTATEYFSCNVTVNNLKTVGTGACAGCTEPICIVFNSLLVTTQDVARNVLIGSPSAPSSAQVTWQGTGPDCSVVPTKNVTWGQVKALYH